MAIFAIEIISDTVCPWCFIGSRKLAKAIALYQNAHPQSTDAFAINWKPFQLNPQFPHRYSLDKQAYYESKYGAARTEQIHELLLQEGAKVGISFKFGGRTGNSRDSHRLVALGKGKGASVQQKIVEELFKAFFENEKDITDINVLAEVAAKAGLSESEVKDWLNSEKGGAQVDIEVKQATQAGVRGVPHFTIQGKFISEGAMEPEKLAKLFEQLKDTSKSTS